MPEKAKKKAERKSNAKGKSTARSSSPAKSHRAQKSTRKHNATKADGPAVAAARGVRLNAADVCIQCSRPWLSPAASSWIALRAPSFSDLPRANYFVAGQWRGPSPTSDAADEGGAGAATESSIGDLESENDALRQELQALQLLAEATGVESDEDAPAASAAAPRLSSADAACQASLPWSGVGVAWPLGGREETSAAAAAAAFVAMAAGGGMGGGGVVDDGTVILV